MKANAVTTMEHRKQSALLSPVDRRATSRLKTSVLGTVKNLTREQGTETALILDVSHAGMRITTVLAILPGDAMQIELQNLTLLAEAVHCERTREGLVIGLKLAHSLDHEALRRCVEPEIWGKLPNCTATDARC